MFAPDQYALLDFGQGRKLERFGELVVDRPAPAAEDVAPTQLNLWESAAAHYHRGKDAKGSWRTRDTGPSVWTIAHDSSRFELRRTPFGHVGIFPEQAENWDWLSDAVARTPDSLKLLNLFAYTGGSTLSAAAAGANVVHVDASRPVVNWARTNAALSDLEASPIRWITDDARKFVRREVRRGARYDGLILDPPSYGHGAKGEVWKLDEHLLSLLQSAAPLLGESVRLLLCSCHSPGWGPRELSCLIADALPQISVEELEARDLCLQTADGRSLHCGTVARWSD